MLATTPPTHTHMTQTHTHTQVLTHNARLNLLQKSFHKGDSKEHKACSQASGRIPMNRKEVLYNLAMSSLLASLI